MLKRKILAAILTLCIAAGSYLPAIAQVNYYQPPYYNGYGNVSQNGYNQPLQGNVSVLAAGTHIRGTLTNGLSSGVSQPGESFYININNPVFSGNVAVIPAGSKLEGIVTNVLSSGLTGKNGVLEMRIRQIITPNGQYIPCSASIMTKYGANVWKGGTKAGRSGKTFLRTLIGAGIGAALGTALAPASGGSVAKGAIYGTAIGGGAGLISNVARNGREAELSSGTELDLVLDMPLHIAANPGYEQPVNNPYYRNYNPPIVNSGYNYYQPGYNY